LNCERASVFLIDEKRGELWTKKAKGQETTIRISKDTGIVGSVVKTLSTVNILDAYHDDRFNPVHDKLNNFRTKSVLCVPIIDSNTQDLIGVM